MPDGIAQTSPAPLVDQFGRQITYLRISVTDRCDLRCTYCMAEKMQFLPKRDLLTIEELDQVARAFVQRGVQKIRITGGEPLVRKGMPELFERLGAYLGNGLEELTLTTNGTLLSQFAGMLVEHGVKRINVSLDSLQPDRFETITRRGKLKQVLNGIDAALDAGLKVKINTVALKHDNADELQDMIAWAHSKRMDLTLIEVMPLGETDEDRIDQYIPLPMIRDRLARNWTLEDVASKDANAGPSRYVRVKETGGKLGFITPLTNNFCAGCNRVRVTCTGRIYMCLGQDDHIDLRAALRDSANPDEALDTCLDRALMKKPERHEFEITRRGQDPALARHMSVTGG
ncbi:MAG: GTP 3',8-cyclase MoaA [Pseudomonadota bacterium]